MEQHRQNSFLWIKAACWAGVLIDAYVTVLMLDPVQFARTFGITTLPGTALGAGLLAGAPLMAGWALLLFWAHRSPVERKEVLLITAIPVLAGFIAVEMYAVSQGIAASGVLLPVMVLQGILAVWFGTGYFAARKAFRTGGA